MFLEKSKKYDKNGKALQGTVLKNIVKSGEGCRPEFGLFAGGKAITHDRWELLNFLKRSDVAKTPVFGRKTVNKHKNH